MVLLITTIRFLPGHAEYAIKVLDSDNNTLKSTVTQLFELSQYDALIAIYPGMRMKLYLLHPTNNNNHGHPEEVDTESFWAFTKLRLTKFNGIPMQTFFLHLKETEFRFNHRYDDIYDELLKMLRTNPL